MKKLLAILEVMLLLLLLLGCGAGTTVEFIPTSETERIQVQTAVDAQMARAFPQGMTLAGHDQEWYTVISRINEEVRHNLCRPTVWEWKESCKTGRWRYAGDAQWRDEAIK